LQRSRKGMLVPQNYKAMCCDYGGIVQYSLFTDETQRCGNGHFVPLIIAMTQPDQAGPGDPAPAPKPKIIGPATQNNLGVALEALGERESGTGHLTEVIAATAWHWKSGRAIGCR
jgi:hypothetical protein